MDRSRGRIEPVKLVHPLNWNCSDCFHVVKDPTPGSKQMKCCRHAPMPQYNALGQGRSAIIAMNPPVNDGEWCGDFETVEQGIARARFAYAADMAMTGPGNQGPNDGDDDDEDITETGSGRS